VGEGRDEEHGGRCRQSLGGTWLHGGVHCIGRYGGMQICGRG